MCDVIKKKRSTLRHILKYIKDKKLINLNGLNNLRMSYQDYQYALETRSEIMRETRLLQTKSYMRERRELGDQKEAINSAMNELRVSKQKSEDLRAAYNTAMAEHEANLAKVYTLWNSY